jgi:hypothetical protein
MLGKGLRGRVTAKGGGGITVGEGAGRGAVWGENPGLTASMHRPPPPTPHLFPWAGRCPFGTAWADVAVGYDTAHQLTECSNRGHCDHKHGTCECMDGYEGNACQRSEFPLLLLSLNSLLEVCVSST